MKPPIVYPAGLLLGDSQCQVLLLCHGALPLLLFPITPIMSLFLSVADFARPSSVQMLGGILQSGGWPSVVSIMANWFGKGKRGLIMGIWNAHTSVGNILGSVMASVLLPSGWGWAFVAPGLFIGVSGLLVLVFLNPDPQQVPGLAPAYQKIPGKVRLSNCVLRSTS